MAVMRVLFRAELRHRWRSWLLLALMVSLVTGLVLAGLAAGRRTATAFPRYQVAHGYDAFAFASRPIPAMTAIPEVAAATVVGVPAVGKPTCHGCQSVEINDFGVFEVPPKGLTHMVKLVAGRMPDQRNPHEALASFTMQRDFGVHVGSVIRVPFASTAQRAQVLANLNIVPRGPTVRLHIVGIEVSEEEFPTTNAPSYDLYTTQAFARAVNPKAVSFTAYFFRLRHGSSDLPRFEARAHDLGGLSISDLDVAGATVTASIHPQAVGWWILAGLAALVGTIVVAQALARQAIVETDTFANLSALGVSRRQLVAVGMARALAIGTVGVVAGVVLAFLLSPLTPVGEARLADPSDGWAFDPFILLLGALVALFVVLALGLWPAFHGARMPRRGEVPSFSRPSRIVALLTGAGATPSALIGVRHALEKGRGNNAVPVGSALIGAVLAVTALCATAVFGSSLTHLTTSPSLYGQPFTVWFNPQNVATGQGPALLAAIQREPSVSAITAGISGDVVINGTTVDALAGQPLRGPLLLSTTSGRLPRSFGEISIGATTLRQVGARVGSSVRVTVPLPSGATRTSRYRVVGTTAFPPDFGAGALGTGAVITLDGLLGRQCPPGPTHRDCLLQAVDDTSGAYLVQFAPGATGQAALSALARTYPAAVSYPTPPTNLVNFGEAVNFPLILGLVLIVFGAATLTHVLVVSVTRRRREVGLLKSLGFLRRQVAFTLTWQTTTVALIGILVGVPGGIALGRLVWRLFADNLGVVPVPVVPGGVILAVAVGTLVAANLLAIGPALVAARSTPAMLLRSE
jgi:ABC-type lipoprotein release transport system permease subunit